MTTQYKSQARGFTNSREEEFAKEMINPSSDQQSNSPQEHLRLWISDEWYIPVNEQGQCLSICNEGALGFVLQLWSATNEGSRMALKIPRLMAETHRENAYVSELMTQELEAVRLIFQGQGNRRGLLQAQVAAGLLQGPITIRSIREAQEWNDAHVLVRYEKSQNPYFCLVKWENNQLRKFPEGADCPTLDAATFAQLKEKAYQSLFHELDWSKTVFVELNDQQIVDREWIDEGQARDSALSIRNVTEALEKNEIGRTWYTCLPSVMYPWAPYTLQETISLGKRDDSWTVRKHLQLVEQVCSGLMVLHNRGMIHADVRPANVVYEGDAQDPLAYVLSDYGSLAKAGVVSAQRSPMLTGTTVIGPVVQGERASFFYAPERSVGRERENADTAIIIDPGGGASLYVILGWKTDLIKLELLDSNGKPNADPKHYVKFINLLADSEQDSTNMRLQGGDRLQIRDYIFELVDREHHGHNLQAFECKKEYWVVYHGRIVVRCEHNEFESCHSFPISRTIELLQWSASTDLYSLGVLALYSVYCHQLQKSDSKLTHIVNNEDMVTINHKDERLIDERFQEMLTYLANKSHFIAIWRRLEWLRRQLEERLVHDQVDNDFAKLSFERHPVLDSEKKQRTLKEEAEAVVSRITQTVPGTEDLLRALDCNLGSFIFYLHFVLRCLHRVDDLEVQEEWMTVPFCKNRHEIPGIGAAGIALTRLREIQDILQKPTLKSLIIEPESISGFDLRPETEIRADVHALRDREKELVKQVQGFQKQEQQWNEEVENLRQNQQAVEETLSHLQTELQNIRTAKQELDAEWHSVNEYIGKALKMMDNATQFNPFEVIRIFQEVKDSFWNAYRPSASPQQNGSKM